MLKKKLKPAFFQQFNSFIQAIPTQNTTTLAHPLLDSYLKHYSLTTINKEYAKDYVIWQSYISGYRIVEQRWRAKEPNGQTIVLSHGYFDHTALYGKAIRWALSQGYDLHSFDLPGHGLSSGKRAGIDSFDQYSHILRTIIHRENYENYLCLGQSTGCSVILNALLDPSIDSAEIKLPNQLILLSPLVRSLHWRYLRWLYYLLQSLVSTIKRAMISSSHDQQFTYFLHHLDPLQTQKVPLNWLGAMDEWVEKKKTLEPHPQQKAIVIQGTEDNTVDYPYNIPEIKRCLPNMETHYLEGAFHQLVNESDEYWEQVTKLLT